MSDEFEKRMAERGARKERLEREREEQRQRDMLVLDQLEQEHGDDAVKPVWTNGGLVVIRCPKKPEMKRWRDTLFAEKKGGGGGGSAKVGASHALAKASVLHPSPEEYEALVERFPGIPDVVAAAAIKFAGAGEEEEAGKS